MAKKKRKNDICTNARVLSVIKKRQKRLEDAQKERRLKDKRSDSQKLANAIRSRITLLIKNNKNSVTFDLEYLTGCSIDECKRYLEKQFENNMSWANHGEWHIDHIKPCASFDLTKEEECLKCFHYTNLQPLWARDNLIKGSKIK